MALNQSLKLGITQQVEEKKKKEEEEKPASRRTLGSARAFLAAFC